MSKDFEDNELTKEMSSAIMAMVAKNISAKKQINVEKLRRFGIARKAFLKLIEQENVIVEGEPTAVLIEEGVNAGFNTASVRAKFVGITVNEENKELFETITKYSDIFCFDGCSEDGWFFAEITNKGVFDTIE